MQKFATIIALTTLTACGGGVTGAIGNACMDADRRAANPALCSCVQRAANATLTGREQTRAAAFFDNPQLAQDTRKASPSGRFWTRYKEFSRTAKRMCR